MEYKEYIPTLEELKAIKKSEIASVCTKIIEAGVIIEGVGSFRLTEKDQINLMGMNAKILTNADAFEYHADGQPCKFYTRQEMTLIINTAMQYIAYHTAYCNSLNIWIANAEEDELKDIAYGVEIPKKYISEVLKVYLEGINNG
jgi:hypothetical protein